MMYIFISLGSPPITSRSRRGGRGRGFRGRGRGFRGRGRGFRGRRVGINLHKAKPVLFATQPKMSEICPGNFTTNLLLNINTIASLLFI